MPADVEQMSARGRESGHGRAFWFPRPRGSIDPGTVSARWRGSWTMTVEQRVDELERENAELRERVIHLEMVMSMTRMVIDQAYEDRVSPCVS
jgi:hypothetical protein